ncbi:MAG: xanthine dehydrogenase family protein molybdopterin-binding subunit [Hyphomicrobiaceae bacterium]
MSQAFRYPIGAEVPRDRARRLLAGRGRFVDDIEMARGLHIAFVRSPFAHARFGDVDVSDARAMPGVVRVLGAADLDAVVAPWRATHNLFPSMRAPEQSALAIDVARYQGEPVVAIIATTRAVAEDACDAVVIDWEPMPQVGDFHEALAADAPALHDAWEDNIAFEAGVGEGDAVVALAAADLVVERTFRFRRHTGVSLESRAIVADYDPTEQRLIVHQSHQTPHQQQDLYARLLGLPEHKVRVICPDVGGAFGLKHHLYADELVACAAAVILGRPVKFIADRLESFQSDIHCRDHEVHARMGFAADGTIVGLIVEDRFSAGAYGQYPRSSVAEGNQIIRLTGAPYRLPAYAGNVKMAFTNRGILGHIRGVGHPIAAAVTEAMVDLGARQLGQDAIDLRRRNYLADADFPLTSAGGVVFERLSLGACLDKALEIVDVDAFRTEQADLRAEGIHRGIGFCTFVELTSIGPEYYGNGGQHISAQETCILRMEASGQVRAYVGTSDQGQGIDTGIQQVVAGVLGVTVEDVEVISGDSVLSPVGGGSWGSRGAALGGEAALRASRELRGNLLSIAGFLLQKSPDELDLKDGVVVDAATGAAHMDTGELARIGHFRPHTLPSDLPSDLTVTARYASRDRMFLPGNGIQVSIVEVDVETGFVRLLRHVVVHDSGRILNPLLVREQIRGGVVQGIGSALYEELRYDDDGALLTGTLSDYLVPIATEMPDIEVAHIETPTETSELGAKGAGEAGLTGAVGAILNAVNDALAPHNVFLTDVPLSPPRILQALDQAANG